MSMQNHDQLEEDLLFEADGHVTEVVLACLADGEVEIVPRSALDHVDDCDRCTARLGASALRSLVSGEALRDVGAAAASEARALSTPQTVRVPITVPIAPISSRRPRRPIPLLAIAAALVLATAAAMPGFLATASAIPRLLPSLPHLLRVVLALLRAAPSGFAGAAMLLKWASAALFIVVGSAVALSMSRRRSLQEEGGVG